VTLVAVAFELTLLVLAVVLGWLLGTRPLGMVRLGWSGVLVGVAATVPPLVLMKWLFDTNWQPLRRLREEVDQTLLPLFGRCSTADLAIIAVAAGVGEEVLFRGALQSAAVTLAGPALGLILTSVLFGLAHLITPTYAFLAALLGCYLGGLAMLTGGLWVPIFVHALYDYVALAVWLRTHPQQPTDEPGPGPSLKR
jgi:membrane protease YdiL (CAAX protease family)